MNSDNTKEFIKQQMWKAIENILPDSIAKAPFDKTTEGRIVASLGNGKYTVAINGTNYDASVYGLSTFEVNEVVKISIPQNDFKRLYILPKGGSGGGGRSGSIAKQHNHCCIGRNFFYCISWR